MCCTRPRESWQKSVAQLLYARHRAACSLGSVMFGDSAAPPFVWNPTWMSTPSESMWAIRVSRLHQDR